MNESREPIKILPRNHAGVHSKRLTRVLSARYGREIGFDIVEGAGEKEGKIISAFKRKIGSVNGWLLGLDLPLPVAFPRVDSLFLLLLSYLNRNWL